jgi:hypothetical protein
MITIETIKKVVHNDPSFVPTPTIAKAVNKQYFLSIEFMENRLKRSSAHFTEDMWRDTYFDMMHHLNDKFDRTHPADKRFRMNATDFIVGKLFDQDNVLLASLTGKGYYSRQNVFDHLITSTQHKGVVRCEIIANDQIYSSFKRKI